MKIINPSVELIDNINAADIYAKIERCGRVCYQSEPKGKPEEFIRMLIKRGHESVLEHVSLTFNVISSRGVMDEFTRHRLASYSVESTRYCKYNELEVIAPMLPPAELPYRIWYSETLRAEESYRAMIDNGAKPEEARSVLNLSTKSEYYVTANLREWRHIFKLRTSPKAHPEMRFIAGQILSTFKEKLPVIVEDIS